jgi:hypothetical protein
MRRVSCITDMQRRNRNKTSILLENCIEFLVELDGGSSRRVLNLIKNFANYSRYELSTSAAWQPATL